MSFRAVFISLFSFAIFAHAHAQADEAKLLRTAQSLYEGVRTETLPNGLRIFLKPIPGSPVVTTMVAYKVGSADEALDQTGLSHYLEHLMFKGTEKLKPGDIDRQTQRNGGHNNAFTSEDMTVFHFDFAADRWTTALAIEADRMRNLRIDEAHEFDQEKGAVISELDGNEDQPWDLEGKLILPLLHGGSTPYGHPIIGEKAHVRAASAEVIKAHYDRWYHPNNAVIVVAGGFDEKEALASITKLFSPIPRQELPKRRAVPLPLRREKIIRKQMASKFETPRILMGFNGIVETHPDVPTLDLVAQILASGKTSRLHKRLIEEDGTSVLIQAGHQPGRYPGWFSLQCEILKASPAEVETAILEEIEKLAKEGPTEAEMKRARRALMAAHVFSHESIHELADTIARGVVANDMAFVQSYLPDLMKVTPADVQKAVQTYLLDQKPVIIESLPIEGEAKGDDKPPVKPNPKNRKHRSPTKSNGAAAFELKDAKTVQLSNGLKLMLLENHRLPIVVIEAAIARVRLYEPADQIGVASLMGDLLDESTENRTGTEIARLIEDTGGSLTLGGSGGSVKVLADDTELALDLLFDCLMNAKFDPDDLESKKEQLLSQLSEDEKLSEERAKRKFLSSIYGDHPYARPSAKADSVKKITVEHVKAFHRKVVVPNNTVVAVVGDFDADMLAKGIETRTKQWKARDLPMLDLAAPPAPFKGSQTIISDPTAAQLNVYIGHLGIKRSNPDYFKLLVMDNILGMGPGFTDRLSSTLRDRQGLAYTVQANIASGAGEEFGTFTGYIGTFPEKFAEVKAGFFKEVEKLRSEVPSQGEVDDAKKYLTGSLAFSLTTCQQAADLLLSIDRYKLGPNYLADYRTSVSKVTPEDVQQMAKKYLEPDKMIIVAAGAIDSAGKALPKK